MLELWKLHSFHSDNLHNLWYCVDIVRQEAAKLIRHIVCYGDSNTHGYYPATDGTGFGRYGENERWPKLLQRLLGDGFLVFEEGLTGRTTAYDDPMRESMNGLHSIYSCLMSHEPVDLLIIMLGTNDVKDRFGLEASDIADGMYRVIRKAESLPAWREKTPKVLLMSPPVIREDWNEAYHQKSAALPSKYEMMAKENGWYYISAGRYCAFNEIDHMHLTRESHAILANIVKEMILTIFGE